MVVDETIILRGQSWGKVMKALDEVDKKIIEVARTEFLTKGIRRTEMKDIAIQAGIGRSTLYRHFASKELISFYIAQDILIELQEITPTQIELDCITGYDKLVNYLYQMTQVMIQSSEKIKFLNEFDQIFTDVYPDSEEATRYVEFVHTYQNPAIGYYKEGIKDGSIRVVDEQQIDIRVILALLFGLAQRVIPREQHYVQEHSTTGEDYFRSALLLLLEPIRQK